jgi:outer membrane protein insertion porin family
MADPMTVTNAPRQLARMPRVGRVLSVSGLALLMGTTAFTAAYAQVPAAPPATAQPAAPAQPQPAPAQPAAPPTISLSGGGTVFINRILVRGNERIDPQTVLSYLPITPGTNVTEAERDAALKSLYATNLFRQVDITVQGSDLIVQVVENPIINRVLFEGNSNLKTDKLRDEVQVRPRGIFTPAKVQQDVQRIIELYRRSGRISATITPKIVELPQKRVDLIFEIDEGPKSGVLDVNFLGNDVFSDNDLRDVIVTQRSVWWKFFASQDNYDPDRIEYDQEQLRKFYRNKGYYDFRVSSAIAELAPQKNGFAVTYTIDEGKRYRFGKVTVDAQLKKLDANVLRQVLPIKEGQLYSDKAIDDANDALTFAAGSVGFAFVDVRPRFTANAQTQTVDVVFQVNEGPRVYVDRINIVGNTVTQDQVIRREMQLAEGDAFNRVLLDNSKNRIKALQFFKNVDIEETPGSAPDRTNLQVKVEEQPTGELAFSAGYSSIDKLIVDLSVTQKNWAGRGESVRARIQTGSLRKTIDFSFTEPRFLGRNLAAGFDLFDYRYDYTRQAGYILGQAGAAVRAGFALGPQSSLRLQYTLRSDNISSNSLICGSLTQPALCTELGTRTTSLVGYTWAYDRRNDPVNPTRGFDLSFSQDVAGVGGDVNYVTTIGEGSWYHALTPKFVVTANGEAGYREAYGGDTLRINDRFFKGGNTFRGFEIAGIGPRDTTPGFNQALGGKLYAIGSLEMSFPTFLPEQYGIKGALFTEVGTLGLLDKDDKSPCTSGAAPICNRNPNIKDDLGLRASAGVSVFWKSPLGPIRLDFSKVLKKDDYDRTETFRFSTTTRF